MRICDDVDVVGVQTEEQWGGGGGECPPLYLVHVGDVHTSFAKNKFSTSLGRMCLLRLECR